MSLKYFAAVFFATAVVVSLLLIANARAGRTLASSNSLANTADSQGTSDRVEAELLVLRAEGFKPNEIKRRPGRFLLALQNYSSEEEISVELKQEIGASIRQLRMQNRQSKFREFLQLPPGRYVLVVTNHPEWVCSITITPH